MIFLVLMSYAFVFAAHEFGPRLRPPRVRRGHLPVAIFRRCVDLLVGVFMGSTWVGAALAGAPSMTF